MLDKRKVFKKNMDFNYKFLLKSIEDKDGYPMDGLLALILSTIKLDLVNHKKLSCEKVAESVQNTLKPLFKQINE